MRARDRPSSAARQDLGRRPCEISTKRRIGTGGSTVARQANGTGQAPGGGRREQRRAPGPRRQSGSLQSVLSSKSNGAAQRPRPRRNDFLKWRHTPTSDTAADATIDISGNVRS
ncbi:hypothetical protein ACI65C_003272 [Semiaphis heraclei]